MHSLGAVWKNDETISSDEEDDEEPPEDGEVVIKFTRELKHRIRAPWSSLPLLLRYLDVQLAMYSL
jgi:hypothetical protein